MSKKSKDLCLLILILFIPIGGYIYNLNILTTQQFQVFSWIWLGCLLVLAVNGRREVEKIKKIRNIDLNHYAIKNNYSFLEKPLNIDEFESFEVLKKIFTTESLDGDMPSIAGAFWRIGKYKNHLVLKDPPHNEIITIDYFDRFSQPIDMHLHFTQIFLYKIGTDFPKFFISGDKTINLKYKFPFFTSVGYSNILKKNKYKNYNFPINKYLIFTDKNDKREFITKEFVDLLNNGIEGKHKRICIESNGSSLIFFVFAKRHDLAAIDKYLNLFNKMISSLNLT